MLNENLTISMNNLPSFHLILFCIFVKFKEDLKLKWLTVMDTVVAVPPPHCRLRYMQRNPFAVEYKVVLLCCLLFLIFLLSPNAYKNSKIGTYSSDCKPFCPNQTSKDVLQIVRKRIQLENRDEFLDEVLKKLDFEEVNLFEIGSMPNAEEDRSIQMDLDNVQDRLGENGTSAKEPEDRMEEADKVFRREQLNKVLSDYISLERSLPDLREPECKVNYTVEELPSMSVIIPFFNEPYSLLLRTVHSVFNRTPGKILREVVLVDDLSYHSELHGKLSRYLATHFPVEKIRLVRLVKREGMIRARMIGAHVAIGDVLMFLGAKCEVTEYWAEPMLERVKEDRTRVVSPGVDEIDGMSFEYNYNPGGEWEGGFRWNLGFDWESEVGMDGVRKKVKDFVPMKTPVMMGRLVGIERKYFWEIGSYDPGMLVMKAQNLELSFRVWQCGGSVEIIRCSRVGHVFREERPKDLIVFAGGMANDMVQIDTARVAEVWMDEFKELYYEHEHELEFWREEGKDNEWEWTNVSGRKEWRKRKGCKGFKWYLDNVYPGIFRMQFNSKVYGQFKNKGTNMCLDSSGQEDLAEFALEAFSCQPKGSLNQTFFLSNKNELRLERSCATKDTLDKVRMIPCDSRKLEDQWEYRDNGQIYSKLDGKCLAVGNDRSAGDGEDGAVTILKTCENDDLFQQWEISS